MSYTPNILKSKRYSRCLSFTVILFLISMHDGMSQTIQSLQITPELEAHSEKWGIDVNGKKSDIRMAVFGPYSVTGIEKLDSGAFKNKFKGGKELSWGSDEGLDQYKIRRTEKSTFYRLAMTGESDSTLALFSVFTNKEEKTETILGAILSKKDEGGGSGTLNANKQAAGIITIINDTVFWKFFIDYPRSTSNKREVSSGISGFLTNGLETYSLKILYSVVSKKGKDSTSPDIIRMMMPRGVSLINNSDEQIAALIFKQGMVYIGKKAENYTGDERVLISKVVEKPTQLAIATLYSIMIGIQGY